MMRHWLTNGTAVLMVLTAFVMPTATFAARGTQDAPKLLNLYLGWNIFDTDRTALANWDVVVLDMDLQWQAPERMRELRLANPGIKLLAYVSAGELADARALGDPTSPSFHLSQIAPEEFFMHQPDGRRMQWWPGAHLMNATDLGPAMSGQRWADALPEFVARELMSTGLWDGVFLDAAYSDITHFFGTNIDPDGNGTANPAASVNAAWRSGMSRLLRNMRAALGPNRIIMNNSSASYASQVNGVLFENFPRYGWIAPFRELQDSLAKNASPKVSAINTNTNNVETPSDYRLMRYGLGSALLADAYYSFDAGDRGHQRTWWYDEYDASLGRPTGPARFVRASGRSDGSGLWMRNYQRGIVVVNSGSAAGTIALPGTYEKLRGVQDPRSNDGGLVRSLAVPAEDARILLGEANAVVIRQSAFRNGEFVRVYDAEGRQVRNGFFAQRDDGPAGATVLAADLAGRGVESLVIAQKGAVTVKTPGERTVTFWPFGRSYAGSLTIAVGNANRDAASEIIVGRDKARPSDVRMFSRAGTELARWTAYHPQFSGGARVGIGDLDGDGLREIVTGAGPGGGPHIRVWKTDGLTWGGSFFAFHESERGGVSVAVGDVDGDGRDEIVVGSGEGARPRVRVFDFRGTLRKEFSLGDTPALNGVTVTVADVAGDGRKEIVVGGISAF
ncbi:VCBS repeat-containing protein [Candidatus Uhrbacteria bacterium]|nr:VCBS repeat-containing protein [Candidatus Uhrbacteria bacterium]